MNISAPFIRHPIGTFLLASGLMLLGAVTYVFLPVASLPSVDFPIIHVSANLPGAGPETVAATVAAPLERRLGSIPGVTGLTSTSTLGSTSISVQFDLDRNVNGAAQDVQSAINAAQADLPGNLSRTPHLHKANPSAFPILILALTSKTLSPSDLYDVADTVIAQRIAQVQGVSDVSVTGAEQPAIRVDMRPDRLAAMGVGLDSVRQAIANANVASPLGSFDGHDQHLSIGINDALRTVDDYRAIPIKNVHGTLVPLQDVADVSAGTRNRLQTGSYDGKPAVLLIVHKSSGANVVDTVKRIKALLPNLDRWIPSGVHVATFSDRTTTIHASVNDLQYTLLASIALVMLVVLLFLRRGVPTVAAGITVPLSLAGTVVLMWLSGFSLDNLSLMALTISVGFVVDDAIVMIENVYRNLEAGMRPLRAAFAGAKQIGFTVLSISISLIAAFSPLLLMGGIVGRLLREFSLTLVYAIGMSALVSLTVTPMICSRFIRRAPRRGETRLDRVIEPLFDRVIAGYTAGLRRVIDHRWLMLGVTGLALVSMAALFVHLPKDVLPRGDTDLLIAITQGAPDASFARMVGIQHRVENIVRTDPAVAHIGDSVGASSHGGGAGSNQARMFISLKPASDRQATAQQIIARLQPKLAKIKDARAFLIAIQSLPSGVHHSDKGSYQFTLWSPELPLLTQWTPKVLQTLKKIPGLTDVSSDRNEGGPQVNVQIDRANASRLHVSANAIDTTLNDAFSQRQISTMYTESNQYQVVLGVLPGLQREVADVRRLHVTATHGSQVPLSAVTKTTIGTAPLAVHHDRQFPSVTFSYNLAQGVASGTAQDDIEDALAHKHPPENLHIDLGSDSNPASAGNELLLIVAALVSVYLVLGVLYESLIHPITIISTLPSAGLGALLALYLTGTALSLISIIGIVLLIGIVKKNGIMLVDFALEGERKRGWSPERAIFEAARERFRPITMTTMAAVLGAVPLIVASGPGSELRRPLGITIVGGLIVSQFLTVYTTPVIYLLMDRMRWRRRRNSGALAAGV